MNHLKAIQDHIVFQFEEAGTKETSHGQVRDQFLHETDWGFEFTDFDESLNMPRWVTVIAVGKDVNDEIKPGCRVLVDALKWTPGVEVEPGMKVWRTSDPHILAIDDDVRPTA